MNQNYQNRGLICVRSGSKSPRSYRYPPRRNYRNDGREDPSPCACLGVFGMSLHTTERDLKRIFSEFGSVDSVQIVHDRLSGRSRGFGFVYFASTRDATKAKENLKDVVIDGMKVRVDYSVTRTGGHGRHNYRNSFLRERRRDRSPVRHSRRSRSRSYSR